MSQQLLFKQSVRSQTTLELGDIGQSAVNGEKLDEVDSFKYLGAVVTDQGSKPDILSRITETTAAPARLKTIWSDMHIMSLSSKIRLMRALVISVLLYACETWTLTADILKNCRPLR